MNTSLDFAILVPNKLFNLFSEPLSNYSMHDHHLGISMSISLTPLAFHFQQLITSKFRNFQCLSMNFDSKIVSVILRFLLYSRMKANEYFFKLAFSLFLNQ